MHYRNEYHIAAFVYWCFRKETKRSQFNPLPVYSWDSFAAAYHIHQPYPRCVEQGNKKVTWNLHSLSSEKANTHLWKVRPKSFKYTYRFRRTGSCFLLCHCAAKSILQFEPFRICMQMSVCICKTFNCLIKLQVAFGDIYLSKNVSMTKDR